MIRRLLASATVAAVVAGGAVVAGASSAAPASTASTAATAARKGQIYYVPVTKRLTVVGHGYGHGHGMSQHGAQGAALRGKRYREILGFYYPGTRMGSNKGLIRVLLTADTSSDVVVEPAKGLKVRDLAASAAVAVPDFDAATQWRLTPKRKRPSRTVVQYRNARGWHNWRTLAGDGQFTADVPLSLVLPDGSTRRYRGLLRSSSPYRDAPIRDTVNVLAMDDYVRGVIPVEMPASWHQQALRSQAVAARTYAAYNQRAADGRYYEICDTTACQVYGGVSAEARSTNRAVTRTSGKILLYDKRPAFTQFSSSSGGWTSDGGPRYLPAQRDPWDDWEGNTHHDWTTTISVRSLESAFGELGSLKTIRVTRREGHGVWGGRVVQVVLEGSADTVALTGDDIRWRYGLESSWFAFQPTPIIATWRELGGRRSILGVPTSAEAKVKGNGTAGARQLFENGRAYWTPRHGAAAAAGPTLRRYRRLGGPSSEYGFPVQTVARTADGKGRKLRLARGMILWSARTGAWGVRGKVLKAYRKRHASAGPLGYPVANVVTGGGEQRGRFQGGVVDYDRSTKRITVTLS